MIKEQVLFSPGECDFILRHAETFEPYGHYKQPECIIELEDKLNLKRFLLEKFSGFGVSIFPPYIKFLRYHEGIHFNLHRDSTGEDGRIRTISVQLTHPDEYAGGDLYIKESEHINNSDSYHFKRNKGNAIMYSAQQLHEVSPVTKGVRHVMLTWLEHWNLDTEKTII